jgi:hypothetical protein
MPNRVDNREINAYLTTTFAEYERTLQDQIFDDAPGLSYMNGQLGRIARGAQSIKKVLGGGERIQVPLLYGKNTTAKSYSGGEQLDTNIQDGITNAFFDWAQYSVSIAITGLQKRGNMGKHRILNLLQAKTTQAEMSIQELLNEHLWSAAVGNGGKDLTGIPRLVDATIAVGDHNPATNTWWASAVDTTAGGVFNTSNAGIRAMRSLFNTITIGNKTPDVIFMPQTYFEEYEAAGQENEKRTVNTKIFDAGFITLDFKGVPVLFDRDMPSTEIYMLNGQYINWYVHRDADLSMTAEGFQTPFGQDTSAAVILLQGNATINNRRRVGKITNVTLT